MKKKAKVDWNKVWGHHNDWWSKEIAKRETCRSCGHVEVNDPDWNAQRRAIQRIVERQLSHKPKKVKGRKKN